MVEDSGYSVAAASARADEDVSEAVQHARTLVCVAVASKAVGDSFHLARSTRSCICINYPRTIILARSPAPLDRSQRRPTVRDAVHLVG